MEKQQIKISFEKYRSRRPGLLPYIRFNDSDTTVKTVGGEDINGNYGQFVCDLKHNITGGSPITIPYAEVISRYNEMQRILSDSIFSEATTKKRNTGGKQDCTTGTAEPAPETKKCLVETSPYGLCQYDFFPLNMSGFTYEGGYYFPNDGDEVIVDGEGLYVLIPDYDRYAEIEAWWKAQTEGIYDPSSEIWNDPFFFCRVVEHDFLGLITVPEKDENNDDIEGIRVPNRVYKQEAPEILDWFRKNAPNESDDIQKAVAERGGAPFSGFLLTTMNAWAPIEGGWEPSIPSLRITTMLTQESGYEGLYETDWTSAENFNEEKYINKFAPHGPSGVPINEISNWYEATSADTPVISESMLYNLMDGNTVELGGAVGVMESSCTLYEATFKTGTAFSDIPNGIIFVLSGETENTISWWEFTTGTTTPVVCGDGEDLLPYNPEDAKTQKYRTLPLFGCVNQMIGTAPLADSKFFFVVKKNCGGFKKTASSTSIEDCESTPMKIPYTERSFHNITNVGEDIYNCDYLDSIILNEDRTKITFEYVIGGKASGTTCESATNLTYIDKTGIRYSETHDYHEADTLIADIDNFYDILVRYDWVDFESDKETVYNEEYRISRKANLATIIGMEIGTIFSEEGMIMAPIFTKEGSEALMEVPKTKFNLVLDRGAGAAFENHFKLGECNSFEDLENYGNNYFNL